MNEATVKFQVSIDMPKGIVPMTMIKMGIASEHLLDDRLDVLLKVEGKPRAFADPLVWVASERVHRLIEVRWRCPNRCGGGRRIRQIRVICGVGDISRRFGWEDGGIVNLADYPSLNPNDV